MYSLGYNYKAEVAGMFSKVIFNIDYQPIK